MRLPRLILAALMMLGAASARAEPVKIRVGWITVPASFAPILSQKPELARNFGKSYVLEPIHFTGSSTMVTALASSDLDIAEVSYSSFGYAIQNGHMDDIRVIADEFQDGVDDYYTTHYVVLKDGPIHAVEDLKGKVVATNVIGAGTDIGMRAMLRRHGLEDKRDYTVIETDYGNMRPLLYDRKIDLMITIPVFYDTTLKERTRILFVLKEVMGTTQILARAARTPFIAKNRAALVDFLEDDLRTMRWYTDPANHEAAVAAVAKFTKQPPERFASWVFTKGDQYRDPNGVPNIAAMQRNLHMQKEFGFLAGDVDVAAHADLGMVEEAAKRLGGTAAR
jgi:sulfonate transport system substrate-binding protein